RTLDIIRKTGYTVDDTIRIQLPKGYQVESVPDKDLNIESSFGTYQLKIETQANQLVLHRKAVMPAFRVPASNYADFRAFMKKVSKAEQGKVVLVKRKT
ncbi:MAG: hypothetical protein AAF798_17475, partial [Bacteroidota bacterium]